MDPAQRAKQLREVLNHHSDLYYNQDAPEISDQEYDGLMRELKALEKAHPELITPDSPTQRVGGSAKRTAGVLVAHRVPMLSMQDLFTQEEVDHFISDCQEKLGEGITFLVETKIDGLSMALRYENGNLVTAITRGDGRTFGEDVTANAKVIDDVAVTLRHPIPYLELRGEVYMTDAAFEAVNERQELLGKKPFANPRNCAAGTLRQLDAAVTRERHLSFFVFNVQDIQGKDLATHEEAYAYLKDCGVTVIAHYYVCKNREEIWKAIQAIGEMRGELPYDIDGAVIKVNDLALRAQLKDTAKNAGYQVAYKYPPEQKETVLREIELSVGRTGKITPTAIFDPVRLCGTTVSRCTLHNQDFITKLGICLGSTLRIEKSGEVIPKCVGVVPEKQPPDAQVFQIPMVCPVCGEPAVREDTADIKCVNLNCPAQLERLIGHFVGRNAMDIKGFGVVYVHDLIAEGYLKDVADIFTLAEHREALIQKGIVGKEKNTDKLLAAIEKAKANPPDRLLTGLGISNVGRSAAQVLMRHFGTLDAPGPGLGGGDDGHRRHRPHLRPLRLHLFPPAPQPGGSPEAEGSRGEPGPGGGPGPGRGPAPLRENRGHLRHPAGAEPGGSRRPHPALRREGDGKRVQENLLPPGRGGGREQAGKGPRPGHPRPLPGGGPGHAGNRPGILNI